MGMTDWTAVWPEELRCHLDDFPRTAAGKVRKTELRAAWRGDSCD